MHSIWLPPHHLHSWKSAWFDIWFGGKIFRLRIHQMVSPISNLRIILTNYCFLLQLTNWERNRENIWWIRYTLRNYLLIIDRGQQAWYTPKCFFRRVKAMKSSPLLGPFLWCRILRIFSVENIDRLGVFMFQTWDNSQLCTDSQYSSQ